MVSSSPNLQLELTVQDFWQASADAASAPQAAAVSDDTWTTWFQTWLTALQPELPPRGTYELSLRLTNDAEIQTLNAQYREKDQPTDVLAFAALEVKYPEVSHCSEEPLYLGDIVISVETAERQAQQQGHSLRQELAWLAAHALLHLLGWDHPDQPSFVRMVEKQTVLLQTVGLSVHYDPGDDEFDNSKSDSDANSLDWDSSKSSE